MSKPSSKRRMRKEIKEYSHLIRALSTSSIADLATYIHPSQSARPQQTAESYSGRVESSPSHSNRDFWTKWPLLPNEVYPPEISFDDEFVGLAEQELSNELPLMGYSCMHPDRLSMSDAPALTGSSLYALGLALSTLSDNFPHVDKGVQYRVKAADWKQVLKVLVDTDVFPDEVLEHVSRRMTILYEPSEEAELTSSRGRELLRQAKVQLEELEAEVNYELLPPID